MTAELQIDRVLGSYIVINELKPEQRESSTGLVWTSNDVSDMRYQEAKVLGVGPEATGVKVGETILYDRAQGHSVTIGDTTYRLIRQIDVAIVL